MNLITLMGRLTKDSEIKTTSSNVSVCSFTIAVDRKFKNADGERQADFIGCVAWRQTGEFISKYFHKGNRILVVGSLQTRTYDDKDGKKVYVSEVVVENVEFTESKKTENSQVEYGKLEADNDTSLPFDL